MGEVVHTFPSQLAPGQRCAVMALTPPDHAAMHTYYDVCPWSPSGRYLTCLRLPFEDHHPEPSAAADVCVIDLQAGTCRSVCRTRAWGFQTAAKQQWGRTDQHLYFNDIVNGRPAAVRLDLGTGAMRRYAGPLWQISPDESYALCPCLVRANLTQPGYGVSVAVEHEAHNRVQAAADDGFYHLDLGTDRHRLWLSLAEVWQAVPNRDELAATVLYAFHVKINRQGTRVMLVARAKPRTGKYFPMLLTCRPDASGLRVVLTSRQWRDGRANHPIWHPDGERILMNLRSNGVQRFVLIQASTGGIVTLGNDLEGIGGHPSLSDDGRTLVTDYYDRRGAPQLATLRRIDVQAGTWEDLITVPSPMYGTADVFEISRRVDMHPVFDRNCRRICFTAAPAGRRQVFVADPDESPARR